MDGIINDKENLSSSTAIIKNLAKSKRFAIGVIAGIFMMIFAPNILNIHSVSSQKLSSRKMRITMTIKNAKWVKRTKQ